jgi:hypothetical protein
MSENLLELRAQLDETTIMMIMSCMLKYSNMSPGRALRPPYMTVFRRITIVCGRNRIR